LKKVTMRELLDSNKLIWEHVPEGGIAIDGGAHEGSFTGAILSHFDHIHSFEPVQENYQRLDDKFKFQPTVSTYNFALGDRPAMVGMKGKRSTSFHVWGEGDIKMTSIDDLDLAPSFIKLDLEGYEYFALKGAERTLLRYEPYVFIEVIPKFEHRYDLPGHAGLNFLLDIGMEIVGRSWPNVLLRFAK
jgi:FkbM family methyltransferase